VLLDSLILHFFTSKAQHCMHNNSINYEIPRLFINNKTSVAMSFFRRLWSPCRSLDTRHHGMNRSSTGGTVHQRGSGAARRTWRTRRTCTSCSVRPHPFALCACSGHRRDRLGRWYADSDRCGSRGCGCAPGSSSVPSIPPHTGEWPCPHTPVSSLAPALPSPMEQHA